MKMIHLYTHIIFIKQSNNHHSSWRATKMGYTKGIWEMESTEWGSQNVVPKKSTQNEVLKMRSPKSDPQKVGTKGQYPLKKKMKTNHW